MIIAPYNFVPLPNKVVFPEWADKISIDRPFEDGISGTITVNYEAQTRVFIGNGKHADNIDPIQNYKAANGKYAIPGSSLRGMLRSVIEIASFGKFNRVTDEALSVRDLANNFYSKQFTGRTNTNSIIALSKAGWLDYEQERGWVLYPVNDFRIEDSLIEDCYDFPANF